jgi:hypothetical protein
VRHLFNCVILPDSPPREMIHNNSWRRLKISTTILFPNLLLHCTIPLVQHIVVIDPPRWVGNGTTGVRSLPLGSLVFDTSPYLSSLQVDEDGICAQRTLGTISVTGAQSRTPRYCSSGERAPLKMKPHHSPTTVA